MANEDGKWGTLPRSDFHLHTNASDAAENCTVANIVRVAEGLGFEELGFTDHAYARSGPHRGMDVQRDGKWLDGYLATCEEIRSTSSSMKLYVGWEVDYFDGGTYSFIPEEHLQGLDYVLLAFHFFGHMKEKPLKELADFMVGIYKEMAAEPYAHIIAHPFYLGGSHELHGAVLREISDAQFGEVFETMKSNGKAAEITAYQFSAESRDVAQSKRMYSIARETGVKFTLDSDAHSLDQLGGGYRALNVLRELGFPDDGSSFVDYEGLMALKEHR